MASKTTSELDELRDELGELRAELKRLMKAVNQDAEDTVGVASGIARQVQRIAGDLEDTAKRTYDRLSDSVSEGAQQYGRSIEKAITDHPFGAATIALAAGVILSRFLDRSR
ncbi:MAG TPA: hypothetical protein VGB82_13905 [Alphaproteobacteria bacterium]